MTHLLTPNQVHALRLLQDHAGGLYGLDLVERSAGGLKRGSVYTVLGELEERGFVRRSMPVVRTPGPRLTRPKYAITAAGARVLQSATPIDPHLLGAHS